MRTYLAAAAVAVLIAVACGSNEEGRCHSAGRHDGCAVFVESKHHYCWAIYYYRTYRRHRDVTHFVGDSPPSSNAVAASGHH